MATKNGPGPSPRERLLSAADELFYDEGVHTVGIDRIIERAGVAKASLYSAFGSKDALVRSYLEERLDARKQRLMDRLARHRTPRARILAVFDSLGEVFAEPGFRGCAFYRASAEGADAGVKKVCDDSRAFTRGLFTDLARQAGVRDAEGLARQLCLLYDGATAGAFMDRDPATAATAKSMAAALLDAATR